MSSPISYTILTENGFEKGNYDGILLISWPDLSSPKILCSVRDAALGIDKGLEDEIAVLPLPDLSAKKLIHSPTGKIDPDYDDVRSIGDAATKGMKRALKAGVRKPLLILKNHPKFEKCAFVTLLGVMEALYVPLQLRESVASKSSKVDCIGVHYHEKPDSMNEQILLKQVTAVEAGRWVARDIGGGDPERMAPPNVQEYVEKIFKNTAVSLTVIDNIETLRSRYPLFAAVDRCARHIERHRGRIIFLEYTPNTTEPIEKTVMLVGKGVTYDTGGADIKAGGVMQGMSRDKCGAAAVAGLMYVVAQLQPKRVKFIAAMCMVRNSVGADCYVSDEIVVARSGTRVRVGNTDAEGRMCMADVLCEMKEMATKEPNPVHIYTIATLTGHACLSVGDGYSIVLDNGPAKLKQHAHKLASLAEQYGDPFEISTIRREDIAFHAGQAEGDDVFQANNLPSSKTARGHQGPAGFLLLASGLDKHGSGSEFPICYSHLDIAASSGHLPDEPTGAPIVALSSMHILNHLN